MRDIIGDFNTWVKLKFKKRNKRFKATSFQIYETPDGKYSGAIISLLTINTLVFLGLWVLEFTPFYDAVSKHFVASAATSELLQRPWTILTCGFTHQSFMHYLANMWGLILVIEYMKKVLTDKQIWFVYIVSVLLGSIAGIFYVQLVQSPELLAISTLRGASAGVLGILTVFVMRYPHVPISLFFFINTTLKWLAYTNIIASVAMMLFNFNAGGGAAHLAGMGFAWVYYKLLRDKKIDMAAIVEPIYTLFGFFKSKKARALAYEPKYTPEFESLAKKFIR
jgi:membrane associated rhomboid family serine protease